MTIASSGRRPEAISKCESAGEFEIAWQRDHCRRCDQLHQLLSNVEIDIGMARAHNQTMGEKQIHSLSFLEEEKKKQKPQWNMDEKATMGTVAATPTGEG